MEEMICKHCLSPFFPKRPDQVFCNPGCRIAWHKQKPVYGGIAGEVIRTDTKKRGANVVVRVSLDDAANMSRFASPGSKIWISPNKEK